MEIIPRRLRKKTSDQGYFVCVLSWQKAPLESSKQLEARDQHRSSLQSSEDETTRAYFLALCILCSLFDFVARSQGFDMKCFGLLKRVDTVMQIQNFQ